MHKIIFISGSPRNGNIEFILKKLFLYNKNPKKMILLREKKIERCEGCLKCLYSGKCWKNDDIKKLLFTIKEYDLIILGTPNYFDNVPGILKDFFDRTSPLLKNKILKGKKIITIVVGGGKIINSKKVVNNAITYFLKSHNIELVESFYFKALLKNDIFNTKNIKKIIKKINKKIESYY